MTNLHITSHLPPEVRTATGPARTSSAALGEGAGGPAGAAAAGAPPPPAPPAPQASRDRAVAACYWLQLSASAAVAGESLRPLPLRRQGPRLRFPIGRSTARERAVTPFR